MTKRPSLAGATTIEPKEKKSRQGSGRNTKYSATGHNSMKTTEDKDDD